MISTGNDVETDDFFELLSRQLGETAEFPDDESPSNDVVWLLEENARLRALAVKLSSLVGDLSDREWRSALAAAELATLNQVRSPRP
ncbi:hypothetical protein [Bradyrhizobium guangdongense]|uniref:hypothetical protein n=1 Tax=Bradyrhizobium guangdongense TaxID=1325090 RepID=UPI0011271EFE|nr:hypothetical protein [Bradyrhizobium guangdongense]